MSNSGTTDELLRRSQAGDMDAFDELVRAHEGWLRGMLRTRVRDWAAADDLAQDAFVTAFRKIRGFRGDSSFETWLRGIALNHLRNFIRKRREVCVGGNEELQELLGAGEEAAEMHGGDTLEALRECLQQIAGPSRALLDTRYVDGKSVREISAETGRGYSALTMQLHRLRLTLADCIKQTMEAWQS